MAQPCRPMNVLVGWEGKHVFELIRDPRIDMKAAAKGAAPDLIVIPAAKIRLGFMKAIETLPREVWARAAAGDALVVFDVSTEAGPYPPRPGNELHRFARFAGVPPERCVYIVQDRDYRAPYEVNCAAKGVQPMTVLNYDYFVKLVIGSHADDGPAVFEDRLADFEARAASRMRRFISLNMSSRGTKVAFLLSLIRDGLWDQGFISFSGFDKARNFRAVSIKSIQAQINSIPGFAALGEELWPYLDTLAGYGPMQVGKVQQVRGRPDLIKAPVLDTPLPHHNQSWFTVVTETEMVGPRRITEKPLKALLNFHPALVLGHDGALAILRGLGFRTFGGYVDESYDSEPDPRARFDRVYAEVRRLCALPQAELHRMERELAGTLTHNARWGLTELPRVFRERIDVELVDRLAEVFQAPARAA
ncbi:MAG: hypothetical protein WDM92_08885 [Caulobacteraceae bacterium]